MLRFGVSKFDHQTYVVVDRFLNKELCVCNAYEGGRDFKSRAKLIAHSLNFQLNESSRGISMELDLTMSEA